MDRDDFIRVLNRDKRPMDREHYKETIKRSIDLLKYKKPLSQRGHYDLIICMEELAELQQALSKELRGKGDPVNILEEVADVLLCIGYIQEIVGLSDELIVSAMNVKIDKLWEEVNYETIGRSK